MTDVKTSPYSKMRAEMTDLLSAHHAIRRNIANHATVHDGKLDAMRKQAEIEARINEGIARSNG
jgi:hypothetical protein